MKVGITLTSSLDIDNKYLELTKQVTSAIAQKGWGIVYGGTAYGMMKVLAESYKSAGGNDLTGVLAKDLMVVTKNYEKFPSLDQEYLVETTEERKVKIISLSDAYLILPGGYGTFEEIGSIVGGQANKLFSKPIAFYNFEGYYDSLFGFLNEMHKSSFSKIDPKDVYYSSSNLEDIFKFFETYSGRELADKFVEQV